MSSLGFVVSWLVEVRNLAYSSRYQMVLQLALDQGWVLIAGSPVESSCIRFRSEEELL